MKTSVRITLLVISLLLTSFAKVAAQDTLSAAQMREDFAYMMEQYERIHPNPTWSLGGERYDELKQQTLARLDRPMTQLDFWRIIARWNQHFDGHTHVGFPPTAPRMPEGMMVFPPYSIVQYRDGKLRFSSYDGMPDSLRGCEITSIDGHPASEVVDSILPYISHESEAHMNTIVLRSLYFYYNLFYGYSPQMTFAYRTADGERSVVLDRRILYEWLVQVGDKGNIGGTGPRDIPWHFSIFPEQGIALFEFNSCGPNDKFEQFDSVVAACIDSVNHYGIGHLFVDISHNGGGSDVFCKRLLCHIGGLPDTVAVLDVTDTEMGSIANPEEKRVTMSFTPKSPLYGGKLYFIQSQFTYSAAILLANLAKQYRLGPVIGEETGGLTTTFTRHNPILLPNSGLTFYCSDKQFRHIGTTGARGVLPDNPLEIGYRYLFRSFTAEELQQMIETTQSEQWKAYLDICKQFTTDMTPCEKMELYARMDSLFDGYIPVRQQEINYMEAALQCGDTATFKRMAFRVVRWKGWNPLVFYYTDPYKFLKDCDWWPELDSIQQTIHGRKDYSYAETLYQMEQADQAARRAFNDPDHTHTKAIEDSLSRRMHEVDSVNLARLIWLVDTLGFPSWDRVCAYGARAAWLIAQHAHPWFQYGYVKQMRKAVADTNADPSNLAYLEDRLRTGRGLPQLYGTQFASTGENNRTVWSCPTADIKNVNLRRGQMLMPPLEYYIEGYLKAETEQGRLDSDTPLTEMGDNYVRYYYLGDQYSLLPIDEQEGVTDAVAYMTTGDYCAAIPIFCSRLSNLYPFVRDLKRYLECLLRSECVGNQYCYISHYEVLERMVLCGYEPDAWLDSLPDTLSAPLLADYANLRDEYLRYLNHEDDAKLTAALASRADFEALLRSGKNRRSATDSGANYHRHELDAWNHVYPLLQKMTDELTKGDYEEFFSLLWREVERGNLHAEDYASLYDRTYYRLHGKDWYGTLAAGVPSARPTTDKHIRTAKPKMLNDRRRAACLPSTK